MDGSPMRNFYSQYGEAKILIPTMDWVVQSAFDEARTDFIKGPPSATAAHQANDRSSNFKDAKLRMETITKNGIDTANLTLTKHIKVALAELKLEHPEVVISSVNETKMIKAIETLTFEMKNGYVQSRKITKSYEVNCLIASWKVYSSSNFTLF
jgi:hypothetical protein